MTSQTHSTSTPAGSVETAGPKRRTLVKAGGVAIAGAALACRPAWAADTAPRKLRMGVVGGSMGSMLPWHSHPDCEVTAVADLLESRRSHLMKTFECSTSYTSLEELVRDDNVDAVAIFTDGPLHVQHADLAMRHGKHVCSAVPACFATIEEAEWLLDIVTSTGLTYMMAETSYYHHSTISARNFFNEGRFGDLFFCEAAYDHPGVEALYMRYGRRTWRYGIAPMHYPTHTTAHLLAVTGERLTGVSCTGWGDDDPICQDNIYRNPFWVQNATFTTNRNHSFRARVGWRGAIGHGETASWIGSDMSFHMHHIANRGGPGIVKVEGEQSRDDAGYAIKKPKFERYEQPAWWQTDMLPIEMRKASGHGGSHTFLANEFISAMLEGRRPRIDVYEALAYTVPGIVAHESSLQGGAFMPIPQYDPPALAQASRTGKHIPQN